MTEKVNAILIAPSDDVATTISELSAGEAGRYAKNSQRLAIVIQEPIPKYHKFAVRDIAQGEVVRKYGEIIGVATQNIVQGCHVHEHNLASPAANPGKD